MQKTNLPCRSFPNKLGRYFTLKEWEYNCPLIRCGLCIVTSFQTVQYGKEGGNDVSHREI